MGKEQTHTGVRVVDGDGMMYDDDDDDDDHDVVVVDGVLGGLGR